MSLLIAIGIGVLFTVWLAYHQSRADPFARSRFASGAGPWIGLMVLAAAGAGLYYLAPRWLGSAAAPPPVPSPGPSPTPRPAARLLIPALDVDEPVVTVPLVDGQWNITRLDRNVGWLEGTAERPLEDTSMALIGHVTVSGVERGPFADLWALPPVEQVIYRLGDTEYVYAVVESFKIRANEVDKLYGRSGEHLLLVTCSNWNYITETYNTRLVVDAVLVSQRTLP